ncbi:MAG: tryptophan 7-halogenase, partial [Kangiellaceae bacterium]|nr:tryptophan 7-halogenase [Kangiellaceae bacterium]
MNKSVKKVVIVGGGSAGWLTAGVIAAEHKSNTSDGLKVTLIESPDVKPIGVGEGTWPTMRETLDKIGVSETDFFKHCEASFKQGAKFAQWVTGKPDDFYYHPLVIPKGYTKTDLVYPWQPHSDKISFGDTVCYQGHLCERGLAPKQITTPEYAGVANYAYHLNAPKLGEFLKEHCTRNLGVELVVDHVESINTDDEDYIESLSTRNNGLLTGDLFIDCTGLKSLLLGKHYQIPFVEKKSILFNDSALAVQVPYPEKDSPITSHTVSTAQSAGWIWDIGLPTRRGVGYAFAGDYISDEDADKELRAYLEPSIGKSAIDKLELRKIAFKPGHREKFWHKNCVAVGMSAGFLEPLEASALVLIELAAAKISQELPANRAVMKITSKRYNDLFLYRWDRIIDFLKLHYILSQREDSDYWIDNR